MSLADMMKSQMAGPDAFYNAQKRVKDLSSLEAATAHQEAQTRGLDQTYGHNEIMNPLKADEQRIKNESDGLGVEGKRVDTSAKTKLGAAHQINVATAGLEATELDNAAKKKELLRKAVNLYSNLGEGGVDGFLTTAQKYSPGMYKHVKAILDQRGSEAAANEIARIRDTMTRNDPRHRQDMAKQEDSQAHEKQIMIAKQVNDALQLNRSFEFDMSLAKLREANANMRLMYETRNAPTKDKKFMGDVMAQMIKSTYDMQEAIKNNDKAAYRTAYVMYEAAMRLHATKLKADANNFRLQGAGPNATVTDVPPGGHHAASGADAKGIAKLVGGGKQPPTAKTITPKSVFTNPTDPSRLISIPDMVAARKKKSPDKTTEQIYNDVVKRLDATGYLAK